MQEPIPGGIRFGGAPFGPGMTTTSAYPRGDRYVTESNTRPIFVPAQGFENVDAKYLSHDREEKYSFLSRRPKTRNAPHGVQPQMYKYSRSPSAYGRDYGQGEKKNEMEKKFVRSRTLKSVNYPTVGPSPHVYGHGRVKPVRDLCIYQLGGGKIFLSSLIRERTLSCRRECTRITLPPMERMLKTHSFIITIILITRI